MADLAQLGFVVDTRQIESADRKLDSLARTGSSTERAVGRSAGGMSSAFAMVTASIAGLVSVAGGLSKLVSVSREFDVLNAGLITATGSAENAAGAFKAIEDFATTTPYSLAQATKAFTQLVNLGLTPSEKALTSYGNTAAAMGKDLSQMVEAVADATVGEFERLKEFGIKAKSEGDNVSFTFRGMTTTVKKSADEIEGYLIGLGQNDFAGAMANRMNTLDGAISNLSDSWDGLFRTVSDQGAGSVITSGIRMATDAISELTASIASGQFGGYLDAIGAKFNGWGADIAAVLDFVGQLFSDAGKYWSLDMGESARLIIDAFKNIPENIRAFIQIATVELASFADGVSVYARAIASYFDLTAETVNIEGEFDRISAARASSIESIMGQRDAALQSFTSQTTAADTLRVKYDELNGSVDKSVDRLEQYKVVVNESAKATAGLVKEMSKLDDAALDHFEALEDLDEIEKTRIERKEKEIEAVLDWEDETVAAVRNVATISEKAAERIEQAFADAWLNAFDGFSSVVDGMKNAFKRMLAEMAHMALTKPIMVQIGQMLPAGGFADAFKSVTGTAGAASSIGGGTGAFSSIIGTISSYAAPLAIVASLGSMLSKALGGTGKNGALFGGVVGGLLGSWKTESDMLNLGISGGDVTGSQTTTNVKKKFFKNRRESFTTDFDVSGIDSAFDAISMALSESAQMFGITGADEIIKGFSAAANIDIKGKSQEEVQAAIAEWVGNTTSALVNAVFGDSLDEFKREGEGAIDTVNRLSMNMGAVNAIAQTLGLGFDLTGKAAMAAATNIVDLAGGIEQLATLSTQYYQAFYTEAERQSALASQLTSAFGDLNMAMPMTREGFRSLVDGLDLTSTKGQEAFAALMQLVPGMDQYLSAIEAQTAATDAAAQAALKQAEALKAQGLDLQVRLYEALGQSAEALALTRQRELAATDESLRGLLLQIYAAQDAATAQAQLAQSEREAAQAAQDAADAMQNMIDAAKGVAGDAFSKLQDSIGLEKDRLKTELDLKLETISAERTALEQQRDATISGYQAQGQALEQYINQLNSIRSSVASFVTSTGAVENPFKRLTQMFNEVRGGLLPDAGELQSVLGAISSNGGAGFGSAFEQNRAMAIARNQAQGIGDTLGGRAAGAATQLEAITIQTAQASAYYDEELARLDAAAALAQKLHDDQVAVLDGQLAEAEKTYNALMGIDDRILTVEQAMSEFYAAVDAANGLQLSVSELQVEAINRVEVAVVELGSQIAEMNKPENRIWLPDPIDTSPTVSPMSDEVIALLKELNAAMEATAKHTKTSADALELTQLQSEQA